MGTADYKITWETEVPDYVEKTGRYPARWALLRRAIRELANGKEGVICVQTSDKRNADLAKSAVYSESSKIRSDGNKSFHTTSYLHVKDSGKTEVYILKIDKPR